MVKREIYSVGLKRKVEADVDEIIATPSRGGGFRYQVVGFFTDEDGKQHKCQSMIGKADAQTVAAALGQSLPTTESELKEAETVESFAAEEDATVEAPELLVPEPSSSPNGNGRVLGQHTGGEIISATDASQSLPAHDYIFVGRAETFGAVDVRQGRRLDLNPEQLAWVEAQNRKIDEAAKNPRKNARIIDKYMEELSLYIDSMNAEDQGPNVNAMAMGIEEGEQDIEELAADSKNLSTLLPKAEKGKRIENYNPNVDYGSQFTNLEKGSIYETHTCCCGMPCDSCGKSGLCGEDGMMYDTENKVVSCAVCRGGVMNAEVCAAEFVEVIDSVSNVWSDEADGSETFVVEEELKDYLIEEFYEETFEGLFSVSRHDSGADLWEVTFPYFMSEDVIDSIAQYQTMTDGERYGERDEELADWVSAEEFNARGMVDSDDLFEESSRGISKSTAAIATAVLALGAAYWWSQRK